MAEKQPKMHTKFISGGLDLRQIQRQGKETARESQQRRPEVQGGDSPAVWGTHSKGGRTKHEHPKSSSPKE